MIARTERDGREDLKNRGSDGAHATIKSGSRRQFNVLAPVSPTMVFMKILETERWVAQVVRAR